MKRLLITGATGGLGRNAVTAMLGKGIEVRATGRNAGVGALLAAQGAEFVALDLATASPAELARLTANVDAVWHGAALSSPWGRLADFTAANVTATERLLQAAGQSGVPRFIHVSTPALYFDYSHRLDVIESFKPLAYANAYARTKAEAEQRVQAGVMAHRHMHCTIVRPRAIYGPHDQVLLPRLARLLALRNGRLPLPRGGRVRLDLTYVDNVVHAMWLATHSHGVPSGTAINITNHEPVMLRDVLRELFERHLQQSCRVVTWPYPLLALAARGMQAASYLTQREPLLTPYGIGALAFDMTLDNSRSRHLLGYAPVVGMAEGLKRTAAWIREHG